MDDKPEELTTFTWDWEKSYLDVIGADEHADEAAEFASPLADWTVMNQVSVLMLPGDGPVPTPSPFDFQEPVAEEELVDPEELLAQLLSSTDVADMIRKGPTQEAPIIHLGPAAEPPPPPPAAAALESPEPPAPPPVPDPPLIALPPTGLSWEEIESIAQANTRLAEVDLPAALPEEQADEPWADNTGLPRLPGWATALLIGVSGGVLAALLLWSGSGAAPQLTRTALARLSAGASAAPSLPVFVPPSAAPTVRLVADAPRAPAPPLLPRGSRAAEREARARLRAALMADMAVGREDPFVTAQPLATRPHSAFVSPYNPLILPYPASPQAVWAPAVTGTRPAVTGTETRIKLRLIGVVAVPHLVGLVDLVADGKSYRLQVRAGSRLPGGLTVSALAMRSITVRADRGEMAVPLGEAREARVTG